MEWEGDRSVAEAVTLTHWRHLEADMAFAEREATSEEAGTDWPFTLRKPVAEWVTEGWPGEGSGRETDPWRRRSP